jgi:hypothetical protein
MDGPVGAGAGVLEVALRALWCKAGGGGGRLRQATGRGEEDKTREKMVSSLTYIVSYM